MENQCKIDARKSDAKMMKKERKWSPNGSQNPVKIEKSAIKNEVQKIMKKRETSIKNRPPPGAALGNLQGREPPEKKPKEGKPSRKGNLLSREPSLANSNTPGGLRPGADF